MLDKANQNTAMLLAWLRGMPKARQITLALILAMLLVSLIGLVVHEKNKSPFSLIYFCAPIMWGLWIWCAVQARKEKIGLMLAFMWVAIDLSILITLLSLAAPKVDQSFGVDVTILIAYLPVLMPTGFLHGIIPDWFSFDGVFDSRTGVGASMIVWSQATSWAAAQSILIYWMGRLSWKLKKHDE